MSYKTELENQIIALFYTYLEAYSYRSGAKFADALTYQVQVYRRQLEAEAKRKGWVK